MPTICVRRLDRGSADWRPVQAEQVGDGLYRISEAMPAGEHWQFFPGETVRCRRGQLMAGAEALLAYERSL
jgi:hypothetical protein